MTRRKRVPLQLKGSDEKYFRTREIQTRPEPDPEPEPAPRPAPPAKPKAQARPKAKPAPPPATEGEVVSRIVPLGRALSTQVQDLAERLGVPVDDLLYAARKKAVARLRGQLAGTRKPDLPQILKGGESIRIAVKLSPQEMAQLRTWFDPLDLGLATKPLAPLLAAALRAEVLAMCRAAG